METPLTEERNTALLEAAAVLGTIQSSTSVSSRRPKDGGNQSHEKAPMQPSKPSTETKPDDKVADTPPKLTPKSRSDAVLAAKKRAEERRRAAANKEKKPTPSSSSTTNVTTTSNVPQAPVAPENQMDWFNLLAVVTNPSSGSADYASATASATSNSAHNLSSHARRSSRHGLSSHGTPISLDHVGSDGTRSGAISATSDSTYAASLLNAAGLNEWAGYANSTSNQANATLNSMAAGLDEFTGWMDHYSRKYLGTVSGIDSGSIMGEDEGDSGGIVGSMGVNSTLLNPQSLLEEYEPEFGPDDLPESQLEELPSDLANLDLGSVDGFMKSCGRLGMRFEDRGGGFQAMRNRRKKEAEERSRVGQLKSDENGVDVEDSDSERQDSLNIQSNEADREAMANVEATVPEIFFSPYFDLTDPNTFESLLVISDEEVRAIRTKEAELHALAEKKVKEAEEMADKDAADESSIPRPPPRKKADEEEAVRKASESTMPTNSGPSLSKDSRTTNTPSNNNVITLRKPETFTTHLDAIELVLLDQVRNKSERFFRETNRFSELQQLVTTSVDEVRELRTELQSIKERCVTNVDIVPCMDDTRDEMFAISQVLEHVEDVVNCKSSVASLMSSGDYLGAVEAIRLARDLLSSSPDNDASEHDASDRPTSHAPQHLSLGKLKSLSKVNEQLNEYEKLVTTNLTNELVETFLSWGTDSNVDHRSVPRVSLTTDKRSQIRNVVHSLRVCEQLSQAGAAYQKKLCDLISVTIKAIVTECVADATRNKASDMNGDANTGTKGAAGVASMTLEQFFDCINMLFEQVLSLLWGAFAVNKLCIDEGFILDDAQASRYGSGASSSGGDSERASHTPSATAAALAAAADLSEKSVSELLRLRKEAHSLVSFDGMRHLWDTSLTFTYQLEKFSGRKAYGLRSTLLAQAKSFVERKHESNMSALVAALDSERWVQCNVSLRLVLLNPSELHDLIFAQVSAERQAALTRLCSGRAAFSSRKQPGLDAAMTPAPVSTGREKMTDAEVEGVKYKVVWSCLLLLEMVMDDVACAAHFQTLAANVVGKVAELLRLFNTRSTHLVLGAGAIHSAARLKSINAKHLAIVTQCIALVLAILPHVRAALMAQLPAKQHALLCDLDKIKADYKEHSEKVLSKLVSIIGGLVEHSLAPRISGTDFDARAKQFSEPDDPTTPVECCKFIDNVMTNTKKMYQVLFVMLPSELLRDVFSRIFAYLDHKVPSLFKAAVHSTDGNFAMPTTDEGKLRMISEIEYMFRTLNSLKGVQPWTFMAMSVLERELEITRESSGNISDEMSATGEGKQAEPVETQEQSKPTDDASESPKSHAEEKKEDDSDGHGLDKISGESPQVEPTSSAGVPDTAAAEKVADDQIAEEATQETDDTVTDSDAPLSDENI